MPTHIEFLRDFEKYKDRSIYLLLGPEIYPMRTIFEKFENYERKLFYVEEIELSHILEFIKSIGIFNKHKKLAVIRDIDFKKAEKHWKILFKEFEKTKILELLERESHKIIIYSSLGYFEESKQKLVRIVNEFITDNIPNNKIYLVVLMPYLTKDERRSWLLKKLKQMDLKLSAQQVEKLFQVLPPDLNVWNNEIEKIYLSGVENFDSIISKYENTKIYEFLNYLERNRFLDALKLILNSDYIDANGYVLRTLLNLLYTYENLDNYIKPKFLKKELQKLLKNYEKRDIIHLIYLSLLTDKHYKTFHRGNLSILKLLFHIFEKARRR